jgi:hypothetical protein
MLSLSLLTKVSYYYDLNSDDYYVEKGEPLGQLCDLEKSDEKQHFQNIKEEQD